jgi:peptidoglycan L-alanyl-D-glutamate endopeptidase CwlK
MSGLKFGKRSESNLQTCDDRLQRIARRVLSYGVTDFSVIEGHRTLERQLSIYHAGKSQIDGVNKKGKHNEYPSQAIDVLPYPAVVNGVDVWADKQRFCVLAGLFMAAAAEEGVSIRWGGDWDNDGNNADSNFNDLPHIELIEA